ncbi:hypothetical protein [Pseudopedobacter beijingensis]|uniref:Lipoprotein n=1 Tax=Pseudopedobacter beijingensis TaxID=1207056 RepID=A0ABW4IDK0_9SPHI
MKNLTKGVFLFAGVFVMGTFAACNNNTKHTEENTADSTKKITIEALNESDDFPNAKLTLGDVKTEVVGDSTRLTFNFGVENYELTKQTEDGHAEHCANSKEGQHIHFIMDNKPYAALYKPTNTVTLAKNSEHVLLCFLSRSYHLSVKSPDASVLVKFKIDENGNYVKLEEPTEPMLFYSRPKGEYKGADVDNVLLDFYVKNLKISPQDYKVNVQAADTTFTVDSWTPYLIKGAPAGDLNVKISLVDPQGNNIGGTFGEIERTSKLEP